VSTEEEVSDMAVPELSAIEQQVVLLVAQGRSRHAIAVELGLSLKTVDWHIARGRRKLERAATLHDRMRRAEVGLQPDRIVEAGAAQARTAIDNPRRKT
jgi:DNA-binding NarL/FixJ family response regulator